MFLWVSLGFASKPSLFCLCCGSLSDFLSSLRFQRVPYPFSFVSNNMNYHQAIFFLLKGKFPWFTGTATTSTNFKISVLFDYRLVRKEYRNFKIGGLFYCSILATKKIIITSFYRAL